MVAQRRLLGACCSALHWAVARDGVAALCVLYVSVELECEHVPDRVGYRISGHSADLVRCGWCQQRLLRRGADVGGEAFLSGVEGRDPCGFAACIRRPVYGP